MDVDNSRKRNSFLVPVEKFNPEDRGTTGATCTHMVAKKAAIISKISVSLFEVSSNPGVSMRITRLSSRVKSSVS